MSVSIKIGNFLYKYAYFLYQPLYANFKARQDAFEIELFRKYIKPGDVVLDIGANIGFYTNLFSTLVGEKGKVHCFEPDEKNFGHLKSAVGSFENVVMNNKAVGPETGELKFYTSKSLNVDHRTYKPDVYEKEIVTVAVSIDDYLGAERKADFIKIDIQGFEMEAMQGMKKTLETNTNVKLISEFWPYGLKKAGNSASAYFNYLVQKNFKCYLLEKNSLKELNAEKVKALESLDEKHYFNIFITRSSV